MIFVNGHKVSQVIRSVSGNMKLIDADAMMEKLLEDGAKNPDVWFVGGFISKYVDDADEYSPGTLKKLSNTNVSKVIQQLEQIVADNPFDSRYDLIPDAIILLKGVYGECTQQTQS